MSINHDAPDRAAIVMLFRVDIAEEAAALHSFRRTFGAASEIEAVTQDLFALIVRPGVCRCGEAA